MQGKSKQYKRIISGLLAESLTRNRSILLLGPRQTGKTTLVKEALVGRPDVMAYPLQDPRVRIEIEKDPALLVRQVEAHGGNPLVFIDEAQKVPEISGLREPSGNRCSRDRRGAGGGRPFLYAYLS